MWMNYKLIKNSGNYMTECFREIWGKKNCRDWVVGTFLWLLLS